MNYIASLFAQIYPSGCLCCFDPIIKTCPNITYPRLHIGSPYSWCYYSPQHRKLFCNGPLREEANVANCVWNCGGGQGYAHSLCWPVYTANMSEWRIVGLKDFHSPGAERFPSAQRCEVKGILYSAAIKRKWISLTATDALVRSGNIKLWFCIRIMLRCLVACSRCWQKIDVPRADRCSV